ncbi:MAG: VPLPA-CTERM sorting domain-containing protein [Jannaschia sp.]
MMKKLTAIAIAATLSVGSVSAATFDFGDIAQEFFTSGPKVDGKNYEPTFQQFQANGNVSRLTNGGVTVTNATGSHTNGPASAFLDSFSGGKPGGLGVCSSAFLGNGVSSCSTNFGPNNDDDNITVGETLKISFDKRVEFTDIVIRNAGHNKATGTLLINGSEYAVVNGALAAGAFASIGSGTSFTFAYGGAKATQAYVSLTSVAPVPLPAAGLLLAGALGGVAALRRRRRAAA